MYTSLTNTLLKHLLILLQHSILILDFFIVLKLFIFIFFNQLIYPVFTRLCKLFIGTV